MALRDLFFTSQPTAPPQLGVWYFLLPTSLVVVGVLSIRFAHSKSYQNFWYCGTVDPVAHHQLLVFSSSLAFFRRVFPSIIAGWPCGLFFWPPREASSNILPSWESLAPLWPWFIPFFIPTLFLTFPRSTMSLVTGLSWPTV